MSHTLQVDEQSQTKCEQSEQALFEFDGNKMIQSEIVSWPLKHIFIGFHSTEFGARFGF